MVQKPVCDFLTRFHEPIRERDGHFMIVKMAPDFRLVVNNQETPETVCQIWTVVRVPPEILEACSIPAGLLILVATPNP